jgi:hypothetical protein
MSRYFYFNINKLGNIMKRKQYVKLIGDTIKEALYEPQFPREAYEKELWPKLEKLILESYDLEEMAQRVETNVNNGFHLEKSVNEVKKAFSQYNLSDNYEARKGMN